MLVNRVVVVGDFKKHLEGRERGRENKNKNTQTTRTSRGGCLDQQLAHPPTHPARRGASFRWLVGLVRGVRRVVVVVVVSCPCVLPRWWWSWWLAQPASLGGCHALVLVLVRLHFTSRCCCCCCFVTYPCVVCVFCTFCPCSRLSSP